VHDSLYAAITTNTLGLTFIILLGGAPSDFPKRGDTFCQTSVARSDKSEINAAISVLAKSNSRTKLPEGLDTEAGRVSIAESISSTGLADLHRGGTIATEGNDLPYAEVKSVNKLLRSVRAGRRGGPL
jgi:hypothetical protein